MLTVDRFGGGLVLLKAVDVVGRGPATSAPLWSLASALFAGGGLALLAGRDRAA